MYFADLTPYACFGRPPALTVGWLDASHAFASGDVPHGFIERLRTLARKPTVKTLGFHLCPFCDFGSSVDRSDEPAFHAQYQRWKEAEALGSAEIRVVGRRGTVYAAPTLIWHYVATHRYQPPQEFIEAVMEMAI